MNVRFITSGLGTGGAEFALLRLCKALQALDVAPHVVSLTGLGDLAANFAQAGIAVTAIDLRRARGWLQVRRRLAAIDRTAAADVVQGWMYHGNLVALLLKRPGTPVAWGIRQSLQSNSDKLATRLVIRAGGALSRRADAIIYNSLAGRSQHEAAGFYVSSGLVVVNGIDTDQFAATLAGRAAGRAELRLQDHDIAIGHIARYHPTKDHESFLRAFASIAPQRPHLRAVLAGEGVDPSNAVLTRLASALGIEGRVDLLGRRRDVVTLLSSVDVLCCSSNGEGFPNAVAEAMSCGLPCVATDVGDTRELLGDAGEIVPPRRFNELASALARVADQPETSRREVGARARARIVLHYGIATMAQRYSDLYTSLTQEGRECAASRG
jgi:glycosyltransferase involved in cell wall biosynthesis